METLDKFFSLNVILKGRKDSLKVVSYLHTLIILRHHNQLKIRSNTISIFLSLRLSYRQQTKTMIDAKLKEMMNEGYVTKINTTWKITPLGLQTLSEIERQLNECTFKLRKSDTLKISVKRPNTI